MPQTYTVHRKLPLANLKAKARDDIPGTPNALAILSVDKSFVVQAPTARDRDVWVEKLNAAANENRRRRSSVSTGLDASQGKQLAGTAVANGARCRLVALSNWNGVQGLADRCCPSARPALPRCRLGARDPRPRGARVDPEPGRTQLHGLPLRVYAHPSAPPLPVLRHRRLRRLRTQTVRKQGFAHAEHVKRAS